MENVEQHIRQLLRAEQSLIIPRMGCFVITGKPEIARSKATPENMTEKTIDFDTALQHNDGVLAEQIAASEQVSYEDAMDSIEGFVRHVRVSLETDGAYLIDQVGAFYLDQHDNIRFNPWEAEAQQAGFHLAGETTAVQRTTGERIFLRVLLAAIIVLVAWFHFDASYLLYRRTGSAVVMDRLPDRLPEIRSASPATSTIRNKDLSQPPVHSIAPESAVNTDQSSEHVTAPPASVAYYVVAGTFKSAENAERKLRELKSQGFGGATSYLDERGYRLVAYGRLESRTAAAALREKLNVMGLDARIVRK